MGLAGVLLGSAGLAGVLVGDRDLAGVLVGKPGAAGVLVGSAVDLGDVEMRVQVGANVLVGTGVNVVVAVGVKVRVAVSVGSGVTASGAASMGVAVDEGGNAGVRVGTAVRMKPLHPPISATINTNTAMGKKRTSAFILHLRNAKLAGPTLLLIIHHKHLSIPRTFGAFCGII